MPRVEFTPLPPSIRMAFGIGTKTFYIDDVTVRGVFIVPDWVMFVIEFARVSNNQSKRLQGSL